MTAVVFVVGVVVFFLTVYGTVVAGGLKLTKQQSATHFDAAPPQTAIQIHVANEA
ncbi:MAG: hypothetical protein ACI9N0_001147 [Ilumatobacter sp.]|jgi:hypothetical protein